VTAPTVLEITEVRVEPPLVDRAPASAHRLGIFSRFTSALEWLSGRLKENGPDEDGGLVYYRLDAIVLDGAWRVARNMVFGADDKCSGIIDGDGDKPWGACSPDECRYKASALVGFALTVRAGVPGRDRPGTAADAGSRSSSAAHRGGQRLPGRDAGCGRES